MAQTIAVTRLELSRVIHALESNTKLCNILAEHIHEDAAEGLQGWNRDVLGLASDLREKMRAQGRPQKDSVSQTENTKREDVAAPATATDINLTALTKAIGSLNIQLSELPGALTKLGELISSRREHLECSIMAVKEDNDAVVEPPRSLQQQFTRLEQDTKEANQLIREEIQAVYENIGSLSDKVAGQGVVAAFLSDASGMQTKLSSIRIKLSSVQERVSANNPLTSRVEKRDIEKHREGIAALQAEMKQLKKN